MKLSQETISSLGKIICGDSVKGESLTPYRSGPELVSFFNQFGRDDEYGQGFPSRWMYAEECIHELNGTEKLITAIESAFDPQHFLVKEFKIEKALLYFNKFLDFDGYELRKIGKYYKVREVSDGLIKINNPFLDSGHPNFDYILEQIQKCEQKIADGDYDGAITNARTMLEAVLIDLEKKVSSTPPKYDGNIIKLYKRVQKQFNLDPSRKEISESLRQVLSGLVSIVNGLASVRNKMSDAHSRVYKPDKHHAKLMVNSSRTVAAFLFDTYSYQLEKGLIEPLV